jgi:putative ATP-binding cassette transporter
MTATASSEQLAPVVVPGLRRAGVVTTTNLLVFLVRNSTSTVVIASITGVLAGVATAGLVALIHEATGDSAGAASLAAAFAGLCVLVVASRMVSMLLLVRLSQNAVYDLRLRLSRQILAVPLRLLETVGAPRLLAVLTTDVSVLTAVLPALPVIGSNVAIVLSCLVYLGWLSIKALGAVLVFMVIGIVTYQVPMAWGARLFQRVRDSHDQLFKQLRTLTDGIKELKLSPARRDRFFSHDLSPTANALRRDAIQAHSIYAATHSVGNLLLFVAIAAVLFGGTRLLALSDHAIAGYTLTVLFMMAPLQVVLAMIPMLAEAQTALRKLAAIGASLDGPGEPTAVVAAPLPAATIELIGVRHSYRGERNAAAFSLGPLDMVFWPGEIVFVVGGNGSGKSTLAKVLTGLYPHDSGTILWNGTAVDAATREAYRQAFSAVFSDFFLFGDLSVRGDGIDARARADLVRLQLDGKVEIADGVLSTIELSQGQRKRLALLSACLEDRPIYVFDEWAADQDPMFKDVFYRQILPELRARRKLVVVISHDDRFFDVADRLYKLEDGRLIAA